MPAIIIKNYEHFNKALPNWDTPHGRYIKNKDQYDREMKEGGFVSYEQMKQKTELNAKRDNKFEPSKKALGLVRYAIDHADKNGNVKLSGNAIKALHEMKAIKPKIPNYMKLPSVYKKTGGFNNA